MSEINWKPIRNGDTYCSSACGCGCTYIAYLEAMVNSNELAKRMGKGWSTRVWENLGWHYEVRHDNGFAVVSPSTNSGRFYVSIGHRFHSKHYADPHMALHDALNNLEKEIEKLQSMICYD